MEKRRIRFVNLHLIVTPEIPENSFSLSPGIPERTNFNQVTRKSLSFDFEKTLGEITGCLLTSHVSFDSFPLVL